MLTNVNSKRHYDYVFFLVSKETVKDAGVVIMKSRAVIPQHHLLERA